MSNIKHTLESILTVTVGERAQVPVSVVGGAVERITELEEALGACDIHFNASPALTAEDARENNIKSSLARGLTKAALTTTEDKS